VVVRNLTIQLDEELIRSAKVLAAEKGMSLSAMVAQDLREKLAARDRYQQAMSAALESMAEAAGSARTAPRWTRDDLHDRRNR
jgi:plasmid stability protein